MRVRLVVDSATTEEVRKIAATLSRLQDEIGQIPLGDWRPRMTCEGPEHWGLRTDPLPADIAARVLFTAVNGGL